MNKKEFLKRLEEAMLEHMDISQAAPHIKYYNEFIDSELSKGLDEDEVISALNNPRLIAKNIIENSKSANKYKSDIGDYKERDYNTKAKYSDDINKKSRHISFSVNGKPVSSIWIKVLLILVVAIILFLGFIVLGGVLWIVSRLVLPIMIFGGLCYLFVKVIKRL